MLPSLGLSAYDHFLISGSEEGRAIHPSINIGDYLAANPDIAAAVEAGQVKALDHLLNYGITEGRDLGNGINLKDFANDPTFKAAIASGHLDLAIARVTDVAPFLPTFKPAAGWKAPENLPIPVDFVPVEGNKLVVPEGVKVPEGTKLPEFIESDTTAPTTPTTPTTPKPPVSGGGSTGGDTTPPTTTEPEVTEFTLVDAIAADPLPEGYTLSDATLNLEDVTVAEFGEAKSNAQTIINKAANSDELNLEVTYTLKDSIANLTAADAKVVSDATVYALNNEETELGELAAEDFAIVEGASNKGDYTYSEADVEEPEVTEFTLADAIAADTLPEGYTLSDATLNLEDVTVAGLGEAKSNAQTIITAAANSDALELDVTYTLKDSIANLTAADAEVVTDATSYALNDAETDLGELAAEDFAIVEGASNKGDYTYSEADVEELEVTEFTGEISDAFNNNAVAKDAIKDLDSYTLTGGSLDISGIKGVNDGGLLDLSKATITGNVTVKLAILDQEKGNKGDLAGETKSDQSIKLPSLDKLAGANLTVENMTISATAGYTKAPVTNDVVKFDSANESGFAEKVSSIEITEGDFMKGTDGLKYVNMVLTFNTGDSSSEFTLTLKNLVSKNVYNKMLNALDTVNAEDSLTKTTDLVEWLQEEDNALEASGTLYNANKFDSTTVTISDDAKIGLVGILVNEGTFIFED